MSYRSLLGRPLVLTLMLSAALLSTATVSRADDGSGGATPTTVPWTPAPSATNTPTVRATPKPTPTPVPTRTPAKKSTTSPRTPSKSTPSKPTSPSRSKTPAKSKAPAGAKTPGKAKAPSKRPQRPRHPSRPPQPAYRVPPGWPVSMYIPRIHLTAPVESVALKSVADFKAPFKWGDVAWYDRGPRPGDVGRATVFGHLDSYCCPAAFYLLKTLKSGDLVQVKYKTGAPLTFRVMWGTTFPNTRLPISFLFGTVHERGLSLITCAGVFHRDGTGYDHKMIVYARAVLPNGQLG